MVNQYPAWKYLLLAIIVVFGVIYATPNLYGEDPAVQISHRVNLVNESELSHVRDILVAEGIKFRSIEQNVTNFLVRFDDEDEQLRASSQIREALQMLDSRYSVAINLAPATPDWLAGLNALPMYLGLDLRGGVHFLMQVDMDSAVEKSLQRSESELKSFMRGEKIRYTSVQSNTTGIDLQFSSLAVRDAAKLKIENKFRDFVFVMRDEADSGLINMSLNPTALENEKKLAIEQNLLKLLASLMMMNKLS